MQEATYDRSETTRDLGSYVRNSLSKFDALRAVYDANVGGALGLIGGGVDQVGRSRTGSGVETTVSPTVQDATVRKLRRLYDLNTAQAEGSRGLAVQEARGIQSADLGAKRDAFEAGQSDVVAAGVQGKPRITMEEFQDIENPIWNNVAYEDFETQEAITEGLHQEMVRAGEVVQIPEETLRQVAGSYPDLGHSGMKKVERRQIMRQKMRELKASLRQYLSGLRDTGYEFEVNGRILEARLYKTGILEVLQRIHQDTASMLYHSSEIFRKARYLYSTPGYDSDPNIFRWNYFYTPVRIGDEVIGVRIAVRDMVKSMTRPMDSQIYHWGKRDPTLDGERRG